MAISITLTLTIIQKKEITMFEKIIKTFTTTINAVARVIENNHSIAPGEGIDAITQYTNIAKTACAVLTSSIDRTYRDYIHFQMCFSACEEEDKYMTIDILMQFDVVGFTDSNLFSPDIELLVEKTKKMLDDTHVCLQRCNKFKTYQSEPRLIHDDTGLKINSNEYVYSSDPWAIKLANSLRSMFPPNIRELNISSKPDTDVELVHLPNKKPDIIDEDSQSEETFYISNLDIEKCTATLHIPDIENSKKKSFPLSFDHSAIYILGICLLTNTAITGDLKRKVINFKGITRPNSFHLIKINKIINRLGIPIDIIQDLIDETKSILKKH